MLEDFNEILHNGEKLCGPIREDLSFQDFANMLNGCDMVELTSSGNGFTWARRRHDLWIQSKLDRCFGNKGWFRTFQASNQAFLERRDSDHRPIMVKLLSSQEAYRGSFWFKKRMLHKPMVKEAIVRAWNFLFGNTVADKLRSCRKTLNRWKEHNVLDSKEKIDQIQHELETESSLIFSSFGKMSILEKELVGAYKDEESY